jgi:hypothetical protein
MGAAVLLLVWTTLWTVFTVGVLDPAARMSRGTSGGARHAAVAPERLSGPAVEPWVAAR